jgi:hypothetical protein
VLGIVNGEIVKVTDQSVQKEIDINTEAIFKILWSWIYDLKLTSQAFNLALSVLSVS